MSGNSPALEQRPIVLSAQYARDRVEAEDANRNQVSFRTKYVELYDGPTKKIDLDIHAGDILFSVNRFNRISRKRQRHSNGKVHESQQPFVSSSLNGLQASKDELSRIPDYVPEAQKRRRIAAESITVLGTSRKPYSFLNDGQSQIDDPVIMVGGYTEMHLNGSRHAYAGNLLYWDVPLNDQKQYYNDQQGNTATRKKLLLLPMDSAARLSVESIQLWVKQAGLSLSNIDKCVEYVKELQGGWSVEQEFLFQLSLAEEDGKQAADSTIGLSPATKASLTPLTTLFTTLYEIDSKLSGAAKERAIASANMTFFAHHKPMLDLQDRVIGRCMRGGAPGERVDVLLTV
jgi:hypothetical protein